MVCLVSHEIAEKVHDIRRKVLPRSCRHRATASYTESNQANDALAAACERAQQLCGPNHATINPSRYHNTMARANHFDPHAPGVVNVRHDHPNRAARRAGYTLRPQLRRQVLDEIHRYSIVRSPRSNQRFAIAVSCRRIFHYPPFRTSFLIFSASAITAADHSDQIQNPALLPQATNPSAPPSDLVRSADPKLAHGIRKPSRQFCNFCRWQTGYRVFNLFYVHMRSLA